MLILTRKPDQRIIINGNIVISVLAVDGDRVKIGISAPADVPVLREEVRRAVSGENRSAASHTADRRELEQRLLDLHRGAVAPGAPQP